MMNNREILDLLVQKLGAGKEKIEKIEEFFNIRHKNISPQKNNAYCGGFIMDLFLRFDPDNTTTYAETITEIEKKYLRPADAAENKRLYGDVMGWHNARLYQVYAYLVVWYPGANEEFDKKRAIGDQFMLDTAKLIAEKHLKNWAGETMSMGGTNVAGN